MHILWSHRWEHDKNPEDFFESLFKLDEIGINFRLHVIGEQFTDIPGIDKKIPLNSSQHRAGNVGDFSKKRRKL